ncbi:STAS/SEC14 domain-containing protein [Litorivivens sp.]|uniref:STAS/SEC14 domain-containing protein n=1 Tax=Litorivivens sp. TaxID=2020868 RepID=UPI00356509FD
MLTITPTDQNRVDIEMQGSITKEEMQNFLQELHQVAANMEHGHMVFNVSDFHWPSLGAIGFELTHIGAFFKAYKHFERIAVLCDKTWVRKVSDWEGHLLSWVEIKGFTLDERELAIHWLEHGDAEQAA